MTIGTAALTAPSPLAAVAVAVDAAGAAGAAEANGPPPPLPPPQAVNNRPAMLATAAALAPARQPEKKMWEIIVRPQGAGVAGSVDSGLFDRKIDCSSASLSTRFHIARSPKCCW